MKGEQIPLKALVVDDNPLWLKMLTRLVNGAHYTVFRAKDYDAALRIALAECPGLIVTDIRFQDDDESNIDGLRLLQKLHKQGQLKRSIVVTGYSDPKKREIADQVGALYFEKGNFTREDFQDELGRIKCDLVANGETQGVPTNPEMKATKKNPQPRLKLLTFLKAQKNHV